MTNIQEYEAKDVDKPRLVFMAYMFLHALKGYINI
jgi:hypothetical protein